MFRAPNKRQETKACEENLQVGGVIPRVGFKSFTWLPQPFSADPPVSRPRPGHGCPAELPTVAHTPRALHVPVPLTSRDALFLRELRTSTEPSRTNSSVVTSVKHSLTIPSRTGSQLSQQLGHFVSVSVETLTVVCTCSLGCLGHGNKQDCKPCTITEPPSSRAQPGALRSMGLLAQQFLLQIGSPWAP